MKNNIGITDCETGGFNPEENPITQIAITVIDAETFEDLESYSTFIKPYDDLIITPAALEASRVTMREINKGEDVAKVFKILIQLFKKYSGRGNNSKLILGGHNFGFDLGFLEYLFKRFNQNLYDYVDKFHYDTMKLYPHMEIFSGKFKYNLTNLSERYGFSLTSAHGAEPDVKVTKDLLINYLNRARNASESQQISGGVEVKSSGRKARRKFHFEF